MPPQVNARLLSVSTEGLSEDWDAPSGPSGPAGPAKYSGSAGAYVMEKIRTVYSENAGGLVKQKDVVIIVDSSLIDVSGDPLVVLTGDVVTYTFRGQTYSRKVMDYEAPYLPGLGLQEYVRIHLNPEPVEATLSQN